MSRIGKKPIIIPDDVNISLADNIITVKSGNNQLTQSIPTEIKIEIKDKQVLVSPKKITKTTKALHGLIRSLINNMIIGVTKGYEKVLELQGTGYRVNPKGTAIELSLGFSHPIVFDPPQGIALIIEENKIIHVKGTDKQLVGQTAAKIRHFRKPDAYKGKGIRYKDEIIKLKPGKSAKAAEGGES